DITIDQRYAGEPTSKNELLRGFFYLAGTPTKTEPAGMGVARTYDLSKEKLPGRRLEIVTYGIASGQEIAQVPESNWEYVFTNVTHTSQIEQKPQTPEADATFTSLVADIPSVELSVKGGMQVKGYNLLSVSDEQKEQIETAAVEAGWTIQFNNIKMLVLQRREKSKDDTSSA